MLAEDGSYIRTWKRLSEEGDFDKVDEEVILTGSQGYLNYTGAPVNSGSFTAQTVLGCGDYGRCASACSGFDVCDCSRYSCCIVCQSTS